MIVLIHIIFALTGIACATMSVFRPSSKKLNITYGLVASTLASGTYLTLSTRSNLSHACLSGLIYLGAVSVELIVARRKLAKANI